MAAKFKSRMLSQALLAKDFKAGWNLETHLCYIPIKFDSNINELTTLIGPITIKWFYSETVAWRATLNVSIQGPLSQFRQY